MLTAEAGEIALGTDQGQWERRCKGPEVTVNSCLSARDPMREMGLSSAGNMILEGHCELVQAVVEATGEISEAVLTQVALRGKAMYGLTRKLVGFARGMSASRGDSGGAERRTR